MKDQKRNKDSAKAQIKAARKAKQNRRDYESGNHKKFVEKE